MNEYKELIEWLQRPAASGASGSIARSLAAAADAIKKLVAERDVLRDTQTLVNNNALALALRVKELEAALKFAADVIPDSATYEYDDGLNCHCPVCEALSTSNKTADEVIAEFLGGPVGLFYKDEGGLWHEAHPLMAYSFHTPLYAPRMDVKK